MCFPFDFLLMMLISSMLLKLQKILRQSWTITSLQKPAAIHNINILNFERKTSIKYLDIYLDEHLNWKTQIAHVQGKLTKNLRVLNQLRNYLNLKMLLIYPYLNYGAICWGQQLSANLNKICTKQNKCIRSIFFCKQTRAFFTILSNSWGFKIWKWC